MGPVPGPVTGDTTPDTRWYVRQYRPDREGMLEPFRIHCVTAESEDAALDHVMAKANKRHVFHAWPARLGQHADR